jgi:hypothetical protein
MESHLDLILILIQKGIDEEGKSTRGNRHNNELTNAESMHADKLRWCQAL